MAVPLDPPWTREIEGARAAACRRHPPRRARGRGLADVVALVGP